MLDDTFEEVIEDMLSVMPTYIVTPINDVDRELVACAPVTVSMIAFRGLRKKAWQNLELYDTGALWANGKEVLSSYELANNIAKDCEISNDQWPNSTPVRLATWVSQAAAYNHMLLRHFKSTPIDGGAALTLIPPEDRISSRVDRWTQWYQSQRR